MENLSEMMRQVQDLAVFYSEYFAAVVLLKALEGKKMLIR